MRGWSRRIDLGGWIAVHLGLVALVASATVSGPSASARDAPMGPSFALGGDVIYDGPLDYQLHQRARSVGLQEALREVFADLAEHFHAADLALVNLETPISPRYTDDRGESGAPVFAAPKVFLEALAEAGVDAVSIANNHAYDQGQRGLRHTIDAARAHAIELIGVGKDADDASDARVVSVGGRRIAIAAWTEGMNQRLASQTPRPRVAFLRDRTMQQSLRDARARADFVIALVHWTHDNPTRLRASMRSVAREAAEAGADLVVGHGTHVPGRRERIATSDGREAFVLYSLGNLLASMDEPETDFDGRRVGARDAPVAWIQTRWQGRRLEVQDVEIRPHWIARPSGSSPRLRGGRIWAGRPVDVRKELNWISAARCGVPCRRRAYDYQRRIELVERAMAEVGSSPRPEPPTR